MANLFIGRGNLANSPEGKNIAKKDRSGDFFVATMRVFFGRYKRNDAGELEQSGGFWREVELYGQKGQDAFKLLRKGSRVLVIGEEQEFTGTDEKTQAKVQVFKIVAEDVALLLSRVESVQFAAPREREQAQSHPATANYAQQHEEEEVPF